VKKIALIMKYGLYEWLVIPFGFKNATNTFSHTMTNIFTDWMQKFLKVFVDDLNIHNATWE
jgi:hypothetical protein